MKSAASGETEDAKTPDDFMTYHPVSTRSTILDLHDFLCRYGPPLVLTTMGAYPVRSLLLATIGTVNQGGTGQDPMGTPLTAS